MLIAFVEDVMFVISGFIDQLAPMITLTPSRHQLLLQYILKPNVDVIRYNLRTLEYLNTFGWSASKLTFQCSRTHRKAPENSLNRFNWRIS